MNAKLILPLFAAVLATGANAQELAPHRAVYELSLVPGKGRNSLSSATGKLTYEFTGSSCEGYSTKTRFLTALQNQDGTGQITDMTSASFESGDGKSIRFVTANKANGKLMSSADGNARLQDDGTLRVTLNGEKKESLAFPAGAVFPAQHSLGLLKTARDGEAVFRADLFDGSEGGKKVYATTGIIGANARGEIPSGNPAAKLAGLPRYRVSLSFFESGASQRGEQTALYDIASVMFDNGITYSMQLNYPEFSFEAKLASLEMLPAGVCKN